MNEVKNIKLNNMETVTKTARELYITPSARYEVESVIQLSRMATRNYVIRTVKSRGSGKWTRGIDHTKEICMLCDALGIKYIFNNDAPRQGMLGNHIVVTHVPSKLLNMKK